jgi:hypothetical protein
MTDGLSELRREEREQAAAEAAAAEAATAKKRKRPQYWYPEEPTKDEKDAHAQFELECSAAAFETVTNHYKLAVDLVFGKELFAVKAPALQADQLNQFVRGIYHDIRDEYRLVRKQRTAASVAAGSM